MPNKPFDGPIPGENFTSDTKNYAWHRPPQHSDLDAALDDAFKKLLEKNASVSIITLLEMGVNAVTIADMFCTSGIGAGKWTPDFALLMAGPVTHVIYLMGKSYGVSVNLGIDDKIEAPSASLFKEIKQVDRVRAIKAALGIPVERLKTLAEDNRTDTQPAEQTEADDETGTPQDDQMNPKGGFMSNQDQRSLGSSASRPAKEEQQNMMGGVG